MLLAAAGPLLALVLFPSPVAPVLGLALALGGMVLAWRATRRARRTGGTAPAAGGAVAAGLLGTVLTALLGAALLLFHDEITDYDQCLRGANTRVAAAACRERLEARIEERTGIRP